MLWSGSGSGCGTEDTRRGAWAYSKAPALRLSYSLSCNKRCTLLSILSPCHPMPMYAMRSIHPPNHACDALIIGCDMRQ